MEKLCQLHALADNEAKSFELAGTALVAVKKAGQFYLYLNRCPHRGITLEWQPDQFLDIDRHFIQCASHGALFTIEEGTCIAGPCPGEQLTPVPFSLKGDAVWVDPAAIPSAAD